MHLQFYGFFGRLFLGALLGYLLFRSGSLWTSIIAHFIYNLINVLFAFAIFEYELADPELVESVPHVPWTLWVPSLILFAGLFYVFYRRRESRSENRDSE